MWLFIINGQEVVEDDDLETKSEIQDGDRDRARDRYRDRETGMEDTETGKMADGKYPDADR